MNFRTTTVAATLAVAALFTLPGCAVTRDQESVGAYVDDSAITTAVKAKFAVNKQVDAVSISVETLNGTVMLSGRWPGGPNRRRVPKAGLHPRPIRRPCFDNPPEDPS